MASLKVANFQFLGLLKCSILNIGLLEHYLIFSGNIHPEYIFKLRGLCKLIEYAVSLVQVVVSSTPVP